MSVILVSSAYSPKALNSQVLVCNAQAQELDLVRLEFI